MIVLVDSDVLIEVSRHRDGKLISAWLTLTESEIEVVYSPVSAAELWAGALAYEHDVLTRLFRSLRCASSNEETGRLAGDYLRHYRKSHGLELPDALIAAAAVQNGAMLWTRNRKHYPMKEVTFY
ncbi:MAG TPA: type II toxin-antitoxin system VapC family toxin [Acidobacteriaceae bacterium]|nr:type II toxin-antitoxin system VapC family toxin [Acidobacteriaceae bacterium]